MFDPPRQASESQPIISDSVNVALNPKKKIPSYCKQLTFTNLCVCNPEWLESAITACLVFVLIYNMCQLKVQRQGPWDKTTKHLLSDDKRRLQTDPVTMTTE